MGKKTLFVLAMALLAFICTIKNAAAVESPEADYERYYPKYVDSKEPLSTIKLKDMREFNAAKLSPEVSQKIIMPPCGVVRTRGN